MRKKHPQAGKLSASRRFEDLVRIMEILLGANGCPWDKRQTHSSLLKYLKEEAGEVSRAVRKKDWHNLKEELGDVMLQVVFHSALARRARRFSIGDVIKHINSKLVRRHPHVFGGKKFSTPAQVLVEWKKIKKREKASARLRRRIL